MSHFVVTVVTKTDDHKELERILQPFHEYECTGIMDEYVKFVESEENIEEEWKKQLEKGNEYNYKDIDEFASDYYGYEKRAGKWGRVTNPNSKWDWWQIGGRWSGMLRSKTGEGKKGDSGVLGTQISKYGLDVCKKGDLDLDIMLKCEQERVRDYTEKIFFDKLNQFKENGAPPGCEFMLEKGAFKKWDEFAKIAKQAEDSLRKSWEDRNKPGSFSQFINALESIGDEDAKNIRIGDKLGYGFFGVQTGQTLQERIDSVVPLSTFAFLNENGWHQKGEMGWFGCSITEDENWRTTYQKLLDEVNDEEYITIVDCHI